MFGLDLVLVKVWLYFGLIFEWLKLLNMLCVFKVKGCEICVYYIYIVGM